MPLSAVQPARYEELFAAKARAVQDLLAPARPPAADLYPSSPLNYRMRAEFRIWHEGDALDYVMFHPGDRTRPMTIEDFPIASEAIQALMPTLREALRDNPTLRRRLFQVEFLSTLSGDMLVTLIYHRPLDEAWEQEAQQLAAALGIALVGRSRKQKRVIGRDYVTETLRVDGRDYHYRQYEQAFTQPNARVNEQMLAWAVAANRNVRGDLLELYCGNGNFTLPLSRCFDQVVATEMAKSSIRAAHWNLEHNGIDNVQMIRLSAQEVSQAMAGERVFRRLANLPRPLLDYALDNVFVDPPRAGLDPATEAMVAGFKRIIYVSCNPHTLADNLRGLCRSHRITRFALFDQFPYTDHMECGVCLER